MPDDAEQLRRYVETGSEDAFTEVVHRHVNFVYGAALRMTRSKHRAEEVTQNVFIDLARKAGSLLSRRDLAGWLYISTRYASVQLIRRESRRDRWEQEAELPPFPADSPQGDWSRLAPVLDDVLGRLSAQDRDAILLRFFNNASFAEIGTALQLSENAARMRVDRALDKARKLLASRGVLSTVAALELALIAQPAVAAPAHLVGALPGIGIAGAAAGTATTAVASIWALMNATKLTLAAVALAAAIGIGAMLELKIGQARASLSATDDYLTRLGGDLAKERQRADTAEGARLRQEKNADARRTAALRASSSPKPVASSGPDWKTVIKDPAFQAIALSEYQATMHRWFADLYRQLNFTPDQIQRFESVLMKYQQADMDVGLSAVTLGYSFSDPMLGPLYERNQAALKADLQGLATVSQIEDYDNGRTGANIADHLAAVLQDTQTPLTSGQAGALAQLVNAHTAHANGETDWPAVLSAAPAVLSPSQASLLNSIQSGTEFYRLRWQAYMEAARSGQPAAR